MPPHTRHNNFRYFCFILSVVIIVQRNILAATSYNMADERGLKINKTHHRKVQSLSLSSCPEKLRIHLLERNDPAVFDGAARQWVCCNWTPEFLAQELRDLRTSFRFCARQNPSVNGNSCKKTIMETDCEFEKASFDEFCQWLNGCTERSGCLSRFQR